MRERGELRVGDVTYRVGSSSTRPVPLGPTHICRRPIPSCSARSNRAILEVVGREGQSRVFYEDDFFIIELHAEDDVVVMRRTPTSIAARDVQAAYARPLDLLGPHYRAWGIIIDLRPVVGQSDPGFEKAVAPVRERIQREFARAVFVLRTAAGVLQMQRIERETGSSLMVCRDEAEAFVLARGG